MKSPLIFVPIPPVNPGQDLYMSLSYGQGNQLTDPSDPVTNNQFSATMFGSPGILSQVYFWLASDPGALGSFDLTIYKNGVASLLSIHIPAGATGLPILASDLVHSISFSATDLFSLRAINNALSASPLNFTCVCSVNLA